MLAVRGGHAVLVLVYEPKQSTHSECVGMFRK